MNQEQRRLSATWLNTIASGVVSAGTCGSLLAWNFGARPGVGGLQVLAIVAASILTGLLLHLAARLILGQEGGDR